MYSHRENLWIWLFKNSGKGPIPLVEYSGVGPLRKHTKLSIDVHLKWSKKESIMKYSRSAIA